MRADARESEARPLKKLIELGSTCVLAVRPSPLDNRVDLLDAAVGDLRVVVAVVMQVFGVADSAAALLIGADAVADDLCST